MAGGDTDGHVRTDGEVAVMAKWDRDAFLEAHGWMDWEEEAQEEELKSYDPQFIRKLAEIVKKVKEEER